MIKRYREPFPLMFLLQLYLLGTCIFYLIGPIIWKTENNLLTFSMVLVYQLALYLGYKYASKRSVDNARFSRIFDKEWFIRKFIPISLLVLGAKLIFIARVGSMYGYSNPFDIIFDVFQSSKALYFAEKIVTGGEEMVGGFALSVLLSVISGITFIYLPLYLIYFKELPIRKKIIGFITVIFVIFSKLLFGTNEGFFDIILCFFAWSILRNNGIKRNSIKLIIYFLIMLVAIILAFNYIMSERNGSFYQFQQLGENIIDEGSFWFDILPEELSTLLVWLVFYVCQGYYGMSLALEYFTIPYLGLTFSMFIYRNLNALLGLDIIDETLMSYTNQFGWYYGTNWHTAYTWFASDFTWIGVIPIMFLYGMLLYKSFLAAYYEKSPIAIGMFILLVTAIIFLPANNKIFASAEMCSAFFTYLLIWFLGKRKYD